MIDRQVIEWDKDDIDALKFMKVDVLALGMLTCMKKAFDFLAEHKGVNLDLATIPAEDPRTYEQEFAAQTFKQLEGFGSYGFPESHAASFALIAYASSWVKCWHPDVFCAALLNSQPMGFYAPAQIVRDAQAHGVEIRPICVNASRWDCTLAPTDDEGLFAVRLGMRMVKELTNTHAATVVAARAERPFRSVDDLWRRAGVPSASLVQLAEADAFSRAREFVRRSVFVGEATGRLIKTPAELGTEAQRQRRTRLRQHITHAVKTEDMKIADHTGG